MGMKELGDQLQQVRRLKRLSLNAAARKAEISPAYLQKLEMGIVKAPSPPVLQRLAHALDAPYPELMEIAGYLERQPANGERRSNLLAHALFAEDLTDQEAEALAQYLAFLRHPRAVRG